MVNAADFHRHEALGRIIVVCAGYTIWENHCSGVTAGNGDIGGQSGDTGKVAAGQRQLPLTAHDGRTGHIQLHGGHLRVIRHHIEITRLTGHVAVTVLQIEGDGMHALTEMHQRGGASQNILGIGAAIASVEIEICGLHAGGEEVGALVIVIGNEEAQIAGVYRHAVLQLGLGPVVIHQLDGAYYGGGNVLVVGAVDHAQVIHQDPPLQLALVQLHAIGGIPADTASRGHGAEQHTAVSSDQCSGILGQIGLQILPAGFQTLATCCASVTEVDICVGPACSTVGAGGDLRAQPGNRHALGNIDPNAQCSGRTVNREIIAQAQASAVCASQACPIVFQLDRLMSEADDVGILFICVGHYRTLDHTAAATIVIGCHRIGCHTAEALHRRTDSGVIPRIVVAAVNDHGRSHADVQGNGGCQVTELGGDNRAAGVLHVVRDRKQVVGKCTGALVGDAPINIAILQMDSLRLIGRLEAQIADILIVQAQLRGCKGQLVRVLNMNHSGADDLFAADHVHRHIAGLAGGGKDGCSSLAVDRRCRYSAHRIIRHREGNACRQSGGRCAGVIHGAGGQFNSSVGRIILSVRRNGRMIKFAGSCYSGHNKNRTGNNALTAACGRVAHGQVALTFTLGDVGRGAALIQLNSGHAAQRHHHIGLLRRGVAHGTGCHSAVGLEQNDRTVLLHAHAGTGIVTAVTGLGNDDLSVPNHGDQRVHGLKDLYLLALLGALAGLGLCQSGSLLEHVDRAIVKGCYICAAGIVVMHHAVHHQIARGLTGVDVEPGCVDTAHYVQAGLLLIEVCLRSRGFQRPAQLLGVAVAVAGHNLGAAIGRVDLHDVGHSLGVASRIVGDDDPLGHIGCDGILLHRCNMIVGAGNAAAFGKTVGNDREQGFFFQSLTPLLL